MNTTALRVHFDKDKQNRLRAEYNKAVKGKKDKFLFDGHLYLTRYAGYLLEYFELKARKAS